MNTRLARQRERPLHKIMQRLLKCRFATGLYCSDYRYMNGFVHRFDSFMSKKKIECRGDVIHVAATCLVNIASGEKMDVRCLETEVPLNLPRQIHIQCGSDIAGGGFNAGIAM